MSIGSTQQHIFPFLARKGRVYLPEAKVAPNFQRTRYATAEVQDTEPPNFMLKPRNNLNR